MRVIEITKITFLTHPLFVTVLLNLCLIIDHVVQLAAKPWIDKYEAALSAPLDGKARIHVYAQSIKIVVAFPEIA
jgi:hypothetical protein